MTEEQIKSLGETMQSIVELLPKKNDSQKKKIQAFELIDKKCCLVETAKLAHESKHPNFELVDAFFKEVHGYIRAKAIKSKLFTLRLEEIAAQNFKDGIDLFDKKEGIAAYNKVLDYYDPNTTDKTLTDRHRWIGFWSLISTKDGVVTGVHLSDTMDRNMFYAAIQKMRMDAIVEEAAPIVGDIAENVEDSSSEENDSNDSEEDSKEVDLKDSTEEEKTTEGNEAEKPKKKGFQGFIHKPRS